MEAAKDVNATFSLAAIMVTRFEYHAPETQLDPTATVRYGRYVTFNRAQTFARVGIRIEFYNKAVEADAQLDGEMPLGLLEVQLYFKHNIDDIDSLPIKTDANGYTPLQALCMQFLGASYSTARGIWFARMAGTALEKIFPPLISPEALLVDATFEEEPWVADEQ